MIKFPFFEDPDLPSLADILRPRQFSETESQLQAFIDHRRERQRFVVFVVPNMSLIHSGPPPSTFVKSSSDQAAAVMDWQYWRARPKLHRELTWVPYDTPQKRGSNPSSADSGLM